jgi:hypothetical protein
MPLGGYCEICDRWVWVDRTGMCQFGHPSSAVHDVQTLKPRGGGSDLPSAAARAVPANRGRGQWWWRHSLWILWTLTLGFLNWLAFFYIGVKARHAAWVAWGFVYLIPLLLTVAALGTAYLHIALPLMVFVSAVSTFHALLVRPEYRAIMFGEAPIGSLPTPPSVLTRAMRPPLPRGMDTGVAEVIRDAQARVDAMADAAESIGRPELRGRIGRICVTAEEILTELRRKPRQVELARGFLSYYLEAADRIVRSYADLSGRNLDSPEVRQTLTRAEESLDGIQMAFDNQLASLLQAELLDLDSEIAVLEKTVRMDNLLSLPAPDGGQKSVDPPKTRALSPPQADAPSEQPTGSVR